MSKTEVEGLLSIDINWLNRQGFFVGLRSDTLTWTSSFNDQISRIDITVNMYLERPNIKFKYTQTDHWTEEKKDFEYNFSLSPTNCFYGGVRWWFICSLTTNKNYCGRRIGKLYKGGDFFGCRHCYRLTYRSRNQNRHGRWSSISKYMDLLKKIDNLESNISHRSYAGKPTKKQMRLYKLYARTPIVYNELIDSKLT